MASLSAKDRVSLCSFTFADGRRCRTPRTGKNPHFCFDHAQKEARARAADNLGKDLAYFFSGRYLSACDLSTALARLIPAVVCGDVKPRTARTVAYMAQTLLQAIHLSQHEYCEAFDDDAWRKSIRNSVNGNHNYRFPPVPQADQPSPPPQPAAPASPVCHPERSEGSQPIPATQPTAQPIPAPAPQTAPSPHTPLPPTSAEFVQHVVAGLSRSVRPGSTGETGAGQAQQPAQTPADCRSPLATSSSPTTRPTPRESSFQASREAGGICFFFKLVTRHSPLATSSSPPTRSAGCPSPSTHLP
jgi:hypothetical protein